MLLFLTLNRYASSLWAQEQRGPTNLSPLSLMQSETDADTKLEIIQENHRTSARAILHSFNVVQDLVQTLKPAWWKRSRKRADVVPCATPRKRNSRTNSDTVTGKRG